MEDTLHQLIEKRKELGEPFPEAKIRSVMYQILKGLEFMHERGIFHRDLKPENLLYTTETIKLTDFGLARPFLSGPPYTEYISTRWYRAPEVLLKNGTYGPAVDVWAVGAIMAEMYLLRPLFPGTSEVNQMKCICTLLGSPSEEEWPEGGRFRASFPSVPSVPLSDVIPHASTEALHLLQALLHWNPAQRPSASEALKYPFFELGFGLLAV